MHVRQWIFDRNVRPHVRSTAGHTKGRCLGHHIQAMIEIDSLVGVAEQVTFREMRLIDPRRELTGR
jgi:hypothetical protein